MTVLAIFKYDVKPGLEETVRGAARFTRDADLGRIADQL